MKSIPMRSIALAAATTLAAGGCTGDGDTEPTPSPTTEDSSPAPTTPDTEDATSTSEAEDEAAQTTDFVADRDPLLTLDEQEGAREDLTDFVCEAVDGTWGASGTLTNPTDEDLVYVVNVGVIESDGGSSLVRRNIVTDVPAGDSVAVEDADLVSTDRDDLRCVLRVNRGASVQE